MRLTPVAILSIAVITGLALVAAATLLALHQPWLGVFLEANHEDGTIRLVSVAPDGPARALPAPSTVLSLEGTGGEAIDIVAGDLIEEPDSLPTFARVADFRDRQSRIREILAQDEIGVATLSGEGVRAVTRIRPDAARPIWSLPAVFWVQALTGLAGFLIGVWVWCLRRQDAATALFALAGVGLMISAVPAGIYSTREIALDGGLFRALSGFNHGGAFLFGAAMIGVFLLYPRRLVHPLWLALPPLILAAWLAANLLEIPEGPPTGSHLPITLAMAAIIVCVALQYRATRGDPAARAALSWLALAVVMGAGTFVLTIITPNLLGIQPAMSQGYAFALFLLIYAGLALGVARFRLFELDEWAFRILFYLFGAILLVVLDAILVLAVSLEPTPAFGLSVMAVGFLYLPLRRALATRFLDHPTVKHEELLRRVMDVALAPSPVDQKASWQALLRDVFNPLRIEGATAGEDGSARLDDDGLTLRVPGAGALPAFRLDHADGGRRLFSNRDVSAAEELRVMLRHALESRSAYEKGAAQERQRITADIHDNIGVQLLGALHSPLPERKDALIREALSDLRDIVNNASRPGLSLDEMLADLRVEIADHLSSAGVGVDWDVASPVHGKLAPQALHALRSILREATSNIIKHSGASTVGVRVNLDDEAVFVEITDDGAGFDPDGMPPGNGLINMRSRIQALGGSCQVAANGSGTRIVARFPAAAPQPGDTR